jgi:capsid protein
LVARRYNHQSTAAAFNEVRADYQAARSSRYRRRRQGIALAGSGADYHYRSEADYLRLIEEARDMDRNDTVVGQIVNRAVENEVQGGMSVDPQTGDKGVDTELWNRWDEWSKEPDQCDISGELTFAQMEELVSRHTKVDGDIFALPSEDGQLQLVEGHRCRTPSGTKRNVVHGVLLDEHRRRRQFWFTKDDVDPMMPLKLVSQVVPYDARDEDGHRQVFQIFNPKRVTQTRGVTAFAPIFDPLGMFEDINFAKMLQQQIVSCFAIFSELTGDKPTLPSIPLGERTTETREDGSSKVLEGIQPGMIVRGKPGEKLSGFSPQVPNESFFQHVKFILTLIGINLGLPLVLVLLDASETNFSGWRGAIDQARMGFKRNQRAQSIRFNRPCWFWKVRQWIAEDPQLRAAADRLKQKIFNHRWNAPSWPYVEPLTDRQAELVGITGCLTSRRRYCEEKLSTDWETLSDEIMEDNAYSIINAKRKAAEINKQFPDDPDPVHWRELISLPLPSGMNVSFDGKNGNDRGDGQKRPQRNQEAA